VVLVAPVPDKIRRVVDLDHPAAEARRMGERPLEGGAKTKQKHLYGGS